MGKKYNSKHVSTSINSTDAVCARRDAPDEELNFNGIEMEIYESLERFLSV